MKKCYSQMLPILLTSILLLGFQSVEGNDPRTISNLNGKWKFNLGDDLKWADPKFDDKDWDIINVPGSWEHEGYVGYDGYAWYRKKVYIPDVDSKSLYIIIRNVDDVDEVYFNGNKIGATGNFPPEYNTAYNVERKYYIPSAFIKPESENLIAVRVYDEGGEGGIVWEGSRICFGENEEYLDYNLAGEWKFKLYDNKAWKMPDFDDSTWKTIHVPMSWESQGYNNYDGNAWYRKTVKIPQQIRNSKLYLCLGKIDDYDKVFFNGELIGEVSPSKAKSLFKVRYNGEYDTRRVYEIPQNLIKEQNVIAIKVYDTGGVGGIYEGPIGIMEEKSLKAYKNSTDRRNHYYDDNFNLGEMIGEVFNDIFN